MNVEDTRQILSAALAQLEGLREAVEASHMRGARMLREARLQRERDGLLQEIGRELAEVAQTLDETALPLGDALRARLTELTILEQEISQLAMENEALPELTPDPEMDSPLDAASAAEGPPSVELAATDAEPEDESEPAAAEEAPVEPAGSTLQMVAAELPSEGEDNATPLRTGNTLEMVAQKEDPKSEPGSDPDELEEAAQRYNRTLEMVAVGDEGEGDGEKSAGDP